MKRRKQDRQTLIGRWLAAAQRRFERARPGSVLIMVVALLVLLALIGTAAMSTSRLDRVSAAQHVRNTQLDIFAESLKNMAIAQTVADLFNGNNGVYRDMGSANTTYDNYDAPGDDEFSITVTKDPSDTNYLGHKSYDAWLGSRLPELVTSTNDVGWRFLSMTPFPSGKGFQVDRPVDKTKSDLSGVESMPKRPFIATSMKFGGRDIPAFVAASGANNPFGELANNAFPAGDADGDGIADSFMVKLGTVAGITYYGSYRIVDQNSAVNINTAMVRDGDFVGAAGGPPKRDQNGNAGFFTSNIGFAEFLADYNPAFKDLNDVSNEFSNVIWKRKLAAVPSGLAGGNGSPFGPDPKDEAKPPTPITSFKYRTLGDAVYMGLGRRLDNPGFLDNSNKFGFGTRPYTWGDGFALAYRFCLVNPSASDSPLERDLVTTAKMNSGKNVPFAPYLPGDINAWFANFNFDPNNNPPKTTPSIRSVFVTYNPTSNAAPTHGIVGQPLYPGNPDVDPTTQQPKYGRMSSTPGFPVKISINTAVFADLWRGFYEVMCSNDKVSALGINLQSAQQNDNVANGRTAGNNYYYGNGFNDITYKNNNELHEGRMFRSSLRPPTNNTSTYLTVRQMMALRSAIAAKNAEHMRRGPVIGAVLMNPDQPIQLWDDAGAAAQFDVEVFHGFPQPFITEIFVHTDINPSTDPQNQQKKNPRGFIAVEIYNPYDFPIDLTDWRLGRIDRSAFPNLKVIPLTDSTGTKDSTDEFKDPSNPTKGISIGSHERMIIHNYEPTATNDPDWAEYVPPSASLPASKTTWIQVKELSSVLAKLGAGGNNRSYELVLLRPTLASHGPTGSNQLYDMMPCDSYDFSGMFLPETEGQDANEWHYCRANDEGAKRWTFVYPGRYDGSKASRRHQGTEHETWIPVGAQAKPDPWIGNPNKDISLGLQDSKSSRNPNGGNNFAPGDPFDFPIQFYSQNTPGPDKQGSANESMFPFGGFARVGDIMHVPFVGSYVIRKAGSTDRSTFIEMNSVTMDAAMAEDTDIADDNVEDVGRFAPVICNPQDRPDMPAVHDVNDLDFSTNGAYALNAKPRYNYHWATRLFDYFTAINNPHDDYLPNKDPVFGSSVDPVPNGPQIINRAEANKGNEDSAPVEGLINLNTAPWRVISALPLITPNAAGIGSYDPVLNNNIARSIVNYRDVGDPLTGAPPHGPFANLFELERVPIYEFSSMATPPKFLGYFADIWRRAASNSNGDAGDKDGDFTPGNGQTDGVIDFEESHLTLNRISNLVTLRSDCFIAYIQVQAWRDVGLSTVRLEGQRRLAVIIDRSRVSASKKTPIVYNIPTAN